VYGAIYVYIDKLTVECTKLFTCT